MGTTRLFRKNILALGLIALLSGYGLACEPAGSAKSDALAPGLSDVQNADLVRASHVMHARVKSPQGETLGQVFDIVLGPDLDSVSYVALSQGGILAIGNKLYAVPWCALSEGVNGAYVLPVTKDQLDRSRGFNPGNWPSAPSQGWASADQGYLYGGPALEGGDVHARRFSRLKGTDVKGSQGADVGNIRDLVIAMDSGRIAYTIVSYGGIIGLGERFAAIPQNAITLEPALKTARVDATKAVVRANSFMPGRWPDLANTSHSQQLAQAFGVSPGGTTLAFIPADDTTAVARARSATTAPAARAATPVSPAALAAPPAPAELNGTFNPSSITTMDGTVVDLGKFQATASDPEMLWLRVRPSSGKTVLVNLGPRDYIGTQDFYIVPGDRIHLSGSEVAAIASGKQVFLPTRVTYGSHTLRLRSDRGTPLWTSEADAVGPEHRSMMDDRKDTGISSTPATHSEDHSALGAGNRSATSEPDNPD